MPRVLTMKNRSGEVYRVEVSDEAAAALAHEGRQRHRAEIRELAERIDPEPTHEDVLRRSKGTGESYELAASSLYTEHEERQERRERQLADPRSTEPTDSTIRERASRTGESYDDAAVALAAELEGGAS